MDQHQSLSAAQLADLTEIRRHMMSIMNGTGLTESQVLSMVSGLGPSLSQSDIISQQPQQIATVKQEPQPAQSPQQAPLVAPQPQASGAIQSTLQPHPTQQQQQPQQHPITPVSPISQQVPYFRNHHARLSVSSTNSASTGMQSIFSANSRTSFDSVATRYEFQQQNQQTGQRQLPPPSVPVTPTSPGQSTKQIAASTQPSPTTPIQQKHHPPSSATSEKIYTCTSCDTGFKRKFDWKRHEEEFHERFKKYPCPDCNRILWGSNSFNQHHKVAHGCKTCPHADAVVKYTRKRTAWGCGFCAAFLPTRERYFDHVAHHFDKERKTKAEWLHSNVIYGLLHQRVIHDIWKAQTTQRAREQPDRMEKLSWDPAKTGRAQGFMEGECAGQLQDLLEFFTGSKDEAKSICRLAYEQADILYSPRSLPPSPTANETKVAMVPGNENRASKIAPQVIVTPAHWTTVPQQVASTPNFTVQGPPTDPRQYRYSVLDRALPRIPSDVEMMMSQQQPQSSQSQPPPPPQPQPQSQSQSQSRSQQQEQPPQQPRHPPPAPQQCQPGTMSFTTALGAPQIIFDTTMNDAAMPDASMSDWQSFATTMVENHIPATGPTLMDFDPQSFYSNPGVWDHNMQ